jgi:hypothetical protein
MADKKTTSHSKNSEHSTNESKESNKRKSDKQHNRHNNKKRKHDNKGKSHQGSAPKAFNTDKKWDNIAAILKDVPEDLVKSHKKIKDACWRCGRTGHRTLGCYTKKTHDGKNTSGDIPFSGLSTKYADEKRKDAPTNPPRDYFFLSH